MTPISAAKEWRGHWLLVAASMIGFSFHSVMHYSMGLFMAPLNAEFGWSSAQLSMGFMISAMIAVPLGPLVGALIDKWGARALALPGLALKCLSIMLFATIIGALWQWYLLWVIYALVALGVKSTVWTAAVSSVFDAGRGMALAVTLCGTALAQILCPPLAQWLIDDYGWRHAFVLLSLVWGVPALIVCFFFLYDVRDIQRRNKNASAPEALRQLRGLTLGSAVRNVTLIRVAIATLITMVLGVGVIVHLVPILTNAEFSREQAAYFASLSGVAGIVGKIATGALMDRFNAGWVGGLTLAAMALSFVLLVGPSPSTAMIVAAVAIIGYTAGCKLQICAYLTSRYGGMRHFGKIFGVMASMIALGAGIGPVCIGLMRDLTGDYSLLMWIGAPAALVSGMLLIGLGPYPDWSDNSEEPLTAAGS